MWATLTRDDNNVAHYCYSYKYFYGPQRQLGHYVPSPAQLWGSDRNFDWDKISCRQKHHNVLHITDDGGQFVKFRIKFINIIISETCFVLQIITEPRPTIYKAVLSYKLCFADSVHDTWVVDTCIWLVIHVTLVTWPHSDLPQTNHNKSNVNL